jgi:hypothetical protein
LDISFINYPEKVISRNEPNRGGTSQILDSRNHCTGKKVAIIGDIHGNYDELSELLDAIDWSPQSQILILTCDLIDRGAKIKETLMFAMNAPSVYSLMSNYEQKLLRYSIILEIVRISSLDSEIRRRFICWTRRDTSE